MDMEFTRPEVNFREPLDASFEHELQTMQQYNEYVYTSLSCENCPSSIASWSPFVITTAGIVIVATCVWFGLRRYYFKIDEVSRH